MDKNVEFILDLAKHEEQPFDREPISNDVKTLLKEGRERIYTQVGKQLAERARQRKKSRN